jgi:hypothetical protein
MSCWCSVHRKNRLNASISPIKLNFDKPYQYICYEKLALQKYYETKCQICHFFVNMRRSRLILSILNV